MVVYRPYMLLLLPKKNIKAKTKQYRYISAEKYSDITANLLYRL